MYLTLRPGQFHLNTNNIYYIFIIKSIVKNTHLSRPRRHYKLHEIGAAGAAVLLSDRDRCVPRLHEAAEDTQLQQQHTDRRKM